MRDADVHSPFGKYQHCALIKLMARKTDAEHNQRLQISISAGPIVAARDLSELGILRMYLDELNEDP